MPADDKILYFPASDYQEALRRIRLVEKNGETALDLGDLSLNELPPELERLVQLRHLALGKKRLCRDGYYAEWAHDQARTSQELTELSRLAKLTRLETLTLCGCESVSDLKSLAGLTALARLDLSRCSSVSNLQPLAGLTGLTVLDLSDCQSVSNLRPLAGLARLIDLNLSSCEMVSDLQPLAGLTGLTALDLNFCHSVSNLRPLAGLARLTDLDVSSCELVSDLQPLAGLKSLNSLNLIYCPSISDLRPLNKLTALQDLYLAHCPSVSDLSPLLGLPGLKVLVVEDTAVPLPDHLRTCHDASAVLAWFRERTSAPAKLQLAQVKLLLVGQGRVGKTHLRQRLFAGEGISFHDPRMDSTQNVDHSVCEQTLPKNNPTALSRVTLQVWDFGGQVELHSSHRFFMGSQRCFYVLVLAADRPANGETSDSNRLNYWLRLIAQVGGNSRGQRAPTLVVVSRCDKEGADRCREEIEQALEVARAHSWFGAYVVDVIWGLGWTRRLSKTTHTMIWNRHEAAAEAINLAIRKHLPSVPDLGEAVSPMYHAARAFLQLAFSEKGISGDRRRRSIICGDDMDRFADLFLQSEAQETNEQREGLRRDCLGLMNSLGFVHWVGDLPDVIRQNNWNLRDIAFNPNWVRRPVYDLIRCSSADPDRAGFLLDEQIEELLPERDSGDASARDLYDRLPFSRDDRGRILELMKACRLIFDNVVRNGVLIPDLLEATSLSSDEGHRGAWEYRADFLPEKVFLRFIARQYHSIDHHSEKCFRNQVIWRKGDERVVLEAHYSPADAKRPYIVIRSVTSKPVPEAVATRIEALFDDIYNEERLGQVKRDLVPAGERQGSPKGSHFVFAFRNRNLPPTANRNAKVVREFTIVFDGVDLGTTWSSLVGLSYLHRLILHAGTPIHVQEFFRQGREQAASGYRFKRENAESETKSTNSLRVGSRLAKVPLKQLKQMLKAAERNLADAADSASKREFSKMIEEITDIIEKRSATDLAKMMRSVQQELRRAVTELKTRMQDMKVADRDLGHFDHCTSSRDHAYHFVYRHATVQWATD